MICFTSSVYNAIMRIFSSLTRKGLYLIFFPDEGNTNSYVGVLIFGKGIMNYQFSKIIYRGFLTVYYIAVIIEIYSNFQYISRSIRHRHWINSFWKCIHKFVSQCSLVVFFKFINIHCITLI